MTTFVLSDFSFKRNILQDSRNLSTPLPIDQKWICKRIDQKKNGIQNRIDHKMALKKVIQNIYHT